MLLQDGLCPVDRLVLVLWKDWDRRNGAVQYFECPYGHSYPVMRDPLSDQLLAFAPLGAANFPA